ncbi:MAG TPA: hypothetical protein VI541_01310, partial [Actinomycetota bacterium]|nr:hypothetical protein [Actinomycetota bacterium]
MVSLKKNKDASSSAPTQATAIKKPRKEKRWDELVRKYPWLKKLSKLKPRWPGFKKLFGPLLLFLIASLFISYGFILRAIQPV